MTSFCPIIGCDKMLLRSGNTLMDEQLANSHHDFRSQAGRAHLKLDALRVVARANQEKARAILERARFLSVFLQSCYPRLDLPLPAELEPVHPSAYIDNMKHGPLLVDVVELREDFKLWVHRVAVADWLAKFKGLVR